MQQLLRRIYDVRSCFHPEPCGDLPRLRFADDAGVPQGPQQIYHTYVVDVRVHTRILRSSNRNQASAFKAWMILSGHAVLSGRTGWFSFQKDCVISNGSDFSSPSEEASSGPSDGASSRICIVTAKRAMERARLRDIFFSLTLCTATF